MAYSLNTKIKESEEALQSHSIGVRNPSFNASTTASKAKQLTTDTSSNIFKTNSSDGVCEPRSVLTNVPNNFNGLKSTCRSLSSVSYKVHATLPNSSASNSIKAISPFPVISSANSLHNLCCMHSQNDETVSINQLSKRLSTISDSCVQLSGKVMSTMKQKSALGIGSNNLQYASNNQIATSCIDLNSSEASSELNVNCTHYKELEESNHSRIFCHWEDCKRYVIVICIFHACSSFNLTLGLSGVRIRQTSYVHVFL